MSNILQPGTLVENRYRVVKLIGKGGMGAVYAVEDQRFGSTVALKHMFLDPNLPQHQQDQVVSAFKREAKTLNHLKHPSLPHVSDYFLDPNGHFLVMEYIQGNDLADWLHQRLRSTGKPFSEQEIIPWMIQVLNVLEYLHSQTPQVIHRDIKPHNIKVAPNGQVYLLDFGISKGVTSATAVSTGKSSIYAYTLDYAPLEQIQGTGTDPRSDLFSLAATMYHMLTGRSLGEEPRCDAQTRSLAFIKQRPDPLTPPPGVSPHVSAVMMQALALDSDHRPASAAAMREALEGKNAPATSETIPVVSPPPPPPTPPKIMPTIPAASIPTQPAQKPSAQKPPAQKPPATKKRTLPIAAIVVGVVMLVLLLGIGMWFIGSGGQEKTAANQPAAVVVEPTNTPTPQPTNTPTPQPTNTPTPQPTNTPTPQPTNTPTPKPTDTILSGHEGNVRSVAFSPDGRTLASGSSDDTIRLWDVATGQVRGDPLRGHEGNVWSVAFSPDGRTLASGGDTTIRLWDVATGQVRGDPLRGHEGNVRSVAFSPDGRTLASGSRDDTIRLWDVATGQARGDPLRGHEGSVYSVAFSPDGQTLASGSWDDTIRLWDVATGQARGKPLRGHEYLVWSVAFSPDGRTLASGSGDTTIRLWDVATGQARGDPLRGHEFSVTSVAFSPDGQTLASGSSDDTIRLWDGETGQQIGDPLRGHEDWVWSVAFSPDGRTLASGSRDSTIRLWRVEQ